MIRAIKLLRYPRTTLRQYKPLTSKELAKRKAEFLAGTVPPIIIRGRFIIDGMQRVETARILGITHINARQIDKMTVLGTEDIHQITPFWSYVI